MSEKDQDFLDFLCEMLRIKITWQQYEMLKANKKRWTYKQTRVQVKRMNGSVVDFICHDDVEVEDEP